MSQPEFDNYSASYEELLKDPIRDRFAGSSLFFHVRKRDLIRSFFARQGRDSKRLNYLDVGCGKGELLSLLSSDFAYVAGCDPSSAMLESIRNIETRVQQVHERIPFEDARFDFVTAVCVYHHVPPAARVALTAEITRLLRPGGVFAIIEHNPFNPATRLIVSRTPVDADAILLKPSETRSHLRQAGLTVADERYFLYLPEKLYGVAAPLENLLQRVPLGGQYAVFGALPPQGGQ